MGIQYKSLEGKKFGTKETKYFAPCSLISLVRIPRGPNAKLPRPSLYYTPNE